MSTPSHSFAFRVLMFGLFTVVIAACFSPPPSHDALESQFIARRQAYEELLRMITEDQLTTVAEYGNAYSGSGFWWASADEAFLRPHHAERYQELMREADCQRIDVLEGGAVAFSMASWGIANRGWRVGAVWSANTPKNLIPSLDNFKKSSSKWEVAYSAIIDHWYLRIVW